ncbi:type II toxin-antitoxin system RelE/ParE family toxin [Petrimonas sp.]|uniref:type II toxin-antitoxin system RelE/ParE family toxin n=1 Tax=Petrimonas sp. TaxID=2023866 RepID=UPI003F512B0B
MKIIWSDFARAMLKDIYYYHKEVAGIPIAQKIRDRIFKTVRQLIKHPHSGQIEEFLLSLNEGHRYLISGNYKIIYKVFDKHILITDVFDTRQNPIKINNPKRNI